MESYIGTKQIKAKPMSKGDYNILRGWKLPADEDFNEEGYLVEYPNSESCHADFDGYISWSPKQVFEESYLSIEQDLETTSVQLEGIVHNCNTTHNLWLPQPYFVSLLEQVKQSFTTKPGVSND